MSLPRNRDELRRRWSDGERFDFFFFYGHKPPPSGVNASCLSQWFVRPFQIDGQTYPTAEHWMMAEKARLFGDQAMLAEILVSEGPREAKACGRKVSGFDQLEWEKNRFDIVRRGNLAKFGQHEDLKRFLKTTAFPQTTASGHGSLPSERTSEPPARAAASVTPVASAVQDASANYRIDASSQAERLRAAILVEAAGRDTIWGIGLGASNEKASDPLRWRGHNLLGFALTEVRESLDA